MAALLTRLRSAGIRVSRKKADLTDPGQVAAAVRSLERGLGPVTAVVHAAASGPVERCDRLSEPTLRSFLGSQRARFGNVIGAVTMERVRVLVTFGSVAARYGRAGGACDALASGLLAEQAARRAEAWPRCRVLHLDWAPWAEPDHGDRAGGRPGTGTPAGAGRADTGRRRLPAAAVAADHGRHASQGRGARAPGRACPAGRAARAGLPRRYGAGSVRRCACTTRAWNWSPTPGCRCGPIPTWPTTASTTCRCFPRRWSWRPWPRPPRPWPGGNCGTWRTSSWPRRYCCWDGPVTRRR